MPLTVIAGLPGSDAPGRLSGRLGAAALEGRRVLFVVPSSAHAARARARFGALAPVGLRAISLSRLVEVEWRLQGDGRHIVEPIHRDVLLARALMAEGVADRPGPGAIGLLGTLVARSCAQDRMSDNGSARDGLAGRVAGALESYLATLRDESLVETSEATRLLAGCAPPADTIGLDAFTALSPDRLALVRGWSRSGCEVVISLPWRAGCAATQPLDALVEQLSSADGEIIKASDPAGAAPLELLRIAVGLFSTATPAPSEGRVTLGVARGDEAEARLIADRVAGLLSAGVPADRIAVAFADPVRHAGWLARAFDDTGIEAIWDVQVPVPETPLGRSMLRMWSLASGPMRREDFSALLRSPFSGVDPGRADRTDASWRSRRVQGRALLDLAGRAGWLVSLCGSLADKPISSGNAKNWKYIADALMANAYGHDAPTPGMDGALDAAVHRAFCQSLTGALSVGGFEIMPRDMWAAFASASVSPASRPVGEGVLITSIRRLGLREFDSVIIGGLTAGETPQRGSDDRLEGEAVRHVMRRLGLTHDPEEHLRGERLAFYLGTTAARSSLMLVRCESDDEGRTLRASVFWDEFLDLYRIPGSDAEACSGLPPQTSRGQESSPVSAGDRCAPRGLLEDERSLALLAGIDAVSPGEVERYAACPYRWFVERRLRARAPDVTVDILTAGLVAHDALAEFYRRWLAVSERRRVTPGDVNEARAQIRAITAEAVCAAPAPTTLEEEWLLASVEPTLVSLVSRDARFLPGYEPRELEWSFGLHGDEPVDLGGVRIKGRADRIDVGPLGLVVIDYKRSHASSLSQIRKGGLVQLQLYALAASQRLDLPVAGGLYRSLAAADDRGFVVSGVPGEFKAADVIDGSEVKELLDDAVRTARDALAGMRAGRIDPSPSREHCAFCSALPFCPQGVRS